MKKQSIRTLRRSGQVQVLTKETITLMLKIRRGQECYSKTKIHLRCPGLLKANRSPKTARGSSLYFIPISNGKKNSVKAQRNKVNKNQQKRTIKQNQTQQMYKTVISRTKESDIIETKHKPQPSSWLSNFLYIQTQKTRVK